MYDEVKVALSFGQAKYLINLVETAEAALPRNRDTFPAKSLEASSARMTLTRALEAAERQSLVDEAKQQLREERRGFFGFRK